jgi:DNA invertase Pin-like site-specific DNA recombinase
MKEGLDQLTSLHEVANRNEINSRSFRILFSISKRKHTLELLVDRRFHRVKNAINFRLMIFDVYHHNSYPVTLRKGRDKRPAFYHLHKDATRRKFSVDRLGRSLKDLIHFLEHLKESNCDLFLHQQGLDTTTSAGRAMFQMIGVFAEFEKSIIAESVKAGMARVKLTGKTKSGRAIGRPRSLTAYQKTEVRERKAKGETVRFLANAYGVSTGTIARA